MSYESDAVIFSVPSLDASRIENRMSPSPVSVVCRVDSCLPGEVANDDLSDLAVGAGSAAPTSARTGRAEPLVPTTTTSDHLSPATASEVTVRLRLSGVRAIDLSAVCSGLVCAPAAADTWIPAEAVSTVLVIGAETYSPIVDPTDGSTAVILGDRAGAVLLRCVGHTIRCRSSCTATPGIGCTGCGDAAHPAATGPIPPRPQRAESATP